MQIERDIIFETLNSILPEDHVGSHKYDVFSLELRQSREFPDREDCMSYVRKTGDDGEVFYGFLLYDTKYVTDVVDIDVEENCEDFTEIRSQLEEIVEECDEEEFYQFAITVKMFQLIFENESTTPPVEMVPVDPNHVLPTWDIPVFLQKDLVFDVIDDMNLRENKMFTNSPQWYQKLKEELLSMRYTSQNLKLRAFKTRHRSAGLSLEHLEHPVPMISGPTFQELKGMLIGFHRFVTSDKFLAEYTDGSDAEARPFWICFAFKAMFKHRFGQYDSAKEMWENGSVTKTDRAIPQDPTGFKETFEQCARQYVEIPGRSTTKLPVFLLQTGEDCLSSMCLESNLDVKKNLFDDKPLGVGDVLKSLLVDYTWEQISVSAHKWGGVPRAHLTFAGNRIRMRDIEDIHEIMRRGSQMIVVESDAKEIDWEEVIRPHQHSGIVQSTTSVKILFLNYGQFCLTLKKLDELGYTTRIGTEPDYDHLFPEFWGDFGERGESEVNDNLLEQVKPRVSQLMRDALRSNRVLSDKAKVLEHAEKEFDWEKQDVDCGDGFRRILSRGQ